MTPMLHSIDVSFSVHLSFGIIVLRKVCNYFENNWPTIHSLDYEKRSFSYSFVPPLSTEKNELQGGTIVRFSSKEFYASSFLVNVRRRFVNFRDTV